MIITSNHTSDLNLVRNTPPEKLKYINLQKAPFLACNTRDLSYCTLFRLWVLSSELTMFHVRCFLIVKLLFVHFPHTLESVKPKGDPCSNFKKFSNVFYTNEIKSSLSRFSNRYWQSNPHSQESIIECWKLVSKNVYQALSYIWISTQLYCNSQCFPQT